jgi:hypothetical protein
MYVARKLYGIRIDLWRLKILWHRERHYVTIPEMAVWQRLACLAPDLPDGWSFADVSLLIGGKVAVHSFLYYIGLSVTFSQFQVSLHHVASCSKF